MRSWYNTINLTGEELQQANARAIAQEQLIEAIFKANPKLKLSPSQFEKLISMKYDRHVPLTSWRRAMTNLTKRGVLTKTEDMVIGMYGEKEHLWCLNGSAKSSKRLDEMKPPKDDGGNPIKQISLF